MKKLFSVDEILFGADYNPEQWPAETWKEDVQLMQKAHVNCVSVAIFSWAKIEPVEGTFEFEWLDTILDMLHQGGIRVNLATATASPPAWLCKKHPDVLPVDANGATFWPGSRQHYNPSSANYRLYASRLVTQIACRYGAHPAVISWHINNEYACHVHESYDDESAAHFRDWLRARYDTVEALNNGWNTAFWSQHYASFDEILPPRKSPYNPNPGQVLDWKRFWSDVYAGLVDMELDIIRTHSPHIPVSTNLVGDQFFLDRRKLNKRLDYASWDSYPDPSLGLEGIARNALFHDFVRSLKRDRPFVLMEQVNTQVNWRPINTQKRPGSMRALSFQSVARGGDGVMYFQWRQSKAGDEMFHGSIVPHCGATGPNGIESKAFREIRELGEDLLKIRKVTGSILKPQVAILFDVESYWALSLPSKPAVIDTLREIENWYRALWNHQIDVDIVHPDEDLSPYKLIVAPSTYLLAQADGLKLQTFVHDGGILLCSFFTGIVNEKNHAYLGGHPALLRDVLGIWVEEWHPLEKTEKVTLEDIKGKTATISNWQELIHASTATVLAKYRDGWLAGKPAVTQNQFGAGSAYYVAADIEAAWLADFVGTVATDAGLRERIQADPGVETSVRHGETDNDTFVFVINHNYHDANVNLGGRTGTDLLKDGRHSGKIRLKPQEVLVLNY